MIRNLRIREVPEELHETVKTIAKNKGESMSDFLKPKIREFVESFPMEIRTVGPVAIKDEMRICGVSDTLSDQLAMICKNIGVSESDLLKIQLKKIADETPAIMKERRDY